MISEWSFSALHYCRIGLVLVVNAENEVDPMADAGVAMLRAFNYILAKDGAAKALSFLTDVSILI